MLPKGLLRHAMRLAVWACLALGVAHVGTRLAYTEDSVRARVERTRPQLQPVPTQPGRNLQPVQVVHALS
jgi:hypothetical protein